jgi:hypothetical protein
MRNNLADQDTAEGYMLQAFIGELALKKRLAVFPSPAGMSLTKLSLDGNN